MKPCVEIDGNFRIAPTDDVDPVRLPEIFGGFAEEARTAVFRTFLPRLHNRNTFHTIREHYFCTLLGIAVDLIIK